MLDNQYFSAQQNRVNGTAVATGVVNIVAIDPNELRAAFNQVFSGSTGKKGVVFKVRFCIPVFRPAGVHDNRLAPDF